MKHLFGFDDALDAFGVHGVGGVAGGVLTGLLATDRVTGDPALRGAFYGRPGQLGLQLYGVTTRARARSGAPPHPRTIAHACEYTHLHEAMDAHMRIHARLETRREGLFSRTRTHARTCANTPSARPMSSV
jgi:hypothetical protein